MGSDTPKSTLSADSPVFLVNDVDLLLGGDFSQSGFDLVITGADGRELVIADYFSFNPPPNLMLPDGAGLSPSVVRALLHNVYEGAMFAGPASAPTPVAIGTVSFIKGEVIRKNASGEEVLQRGDTIYKGDEIIVQGNGLILARMNDGTRFRLGTDGRAILNDFEYNEAAQVGKFEATVLRGGFNYKSGGISKFAAGGNHSKISTPTAVIGIRGSELDGTVSSNGQTIIIHKSGILTVTDINGANPVELTVPGNTSVIVLNGNPSFIPQATPQQQAVVEQSLPPPDPVEEQILEQEEVNTGTDGEAPDQDGGQDGAPEDGEPGDAPAEGENAEGQGEETAGDEGEDAPGDDEAGEDESAEGEDTTNEDAGEDPAAGSDPEGTETEGAGTEGAGTEVSGVEGAGTEGAGTEGSVSEDSGTEGAEGQGSDSSGESESGGDDSGQETAGQEGSSQETSTGQSQSSGADTSPTTGTSTGASTGTSTGTSQTGSQTSTGSTSTGTNTGTTPPAEPQLPPDNPPVARNDAITINQAGATEIGATLLRNDSDPDQNQTPVLNRVTTTGASGQIVFTQATQSVKYTPNATLFTSLGEGATAKDQFTYRVKSGDLFASGQVTITLVGKNDAPIAVNDTYTINENSLLRVAAANGLLKNDRDPDTGDTIRVTGATSTTADQTPIAIQANGAFDFLTTSSAVLNALKPGQTFSSKFTYQITDSKGLTASATATITVTGENDAPVTVADSGAVIEAGTLILQPLANDTDPEGDTLILTGATASSGTVSIGTNGLTLTYIAPNDLAEGQVRQETVTYQVSDGLLTSNGTISISVTGKNDAPIVTTPGAPLEVNISAGPVDLEPAILATISDDSTGLVISALDTSNTLAPVTLGSVIYDPTGIFDYLNVGQSITDSFGFTVQDPQGLSSNGTFSVVINGLADIPQVSGPISFSSLETAGSTTIDLLAGATDKDANDVLSVQNLATSGDVSGITVTGSVVTIDPSQYRALGDAQNAVIQFTYDVVDLTGLKIAQTATITINGVNQAPSATPLVLNVTQSAGTTTLELLTGATDPEGNTISVTNQTTTGNIGGISQIGSLLTINPAFYNSLPVGASESIIYSYNLSDGVGGITPQTAAITVTGLNDTPVAVADTNTVPGNSTVSSPAPGVLVNDTDVDIGDVLTVSAINGSGTAVGVSTTLPSGALLTLNANGDYVYDPNGVFNSTPLGSNNTDVINYTITDSNGGNASTTLTITVTGTNEAPTVGTPPSLTVTEDAGASTLDLLQGAADIDTGDVLSINSLVPTGNNGGITLSGTTLNINPAFYNTLAAGASEVITYTYNVADNNGASVAQTASVTITGVNDAPVAVADTNTVPGNSTVSSPAPGVLVNDTDVDIGDVLTVSAINGSGTAVGVSTTLPSGALLTLNANGDYVYDPNGVFNSTPLGSNNTDVINYTITDSNGGNASTTLTITVTGTNEAPTVGTPPSLTVTEDAGASTLDLLQGAADIDTGDVLSINSLVPTGNNGGITLSGTTLNINPAFYNTLAAGASEVITYTYNVVDNNGASVAQTASVTITGVNDAPVAVADTNTVPGNSTVSSPAPGVLVNDTDVDIGDVLTVSAINGSGTAVGVSTTLPSGALLTLNANGDYIYDPNGVFNSAPLGSNNTDVINYTVTDSNGGNASTTLTITVTGTNEAPTVGTPPSLTVTEDAGASTLDLLQGAADIDTGDVLSINSLVPTGNNGGITLSSTTLNINPAFYNTLAAGASEVITYTYNVVDNNGASVAQTASVTITGVNDAPVAVADTNTVPGNSTVSSPAPGVLANDTDVDIGDVLTVSAINGVGAAVGVSTTLPSGALLTLNANGDYVYDPNGVFNSTPLGSNNTDVINYTVTDSNGGNASTTLTITVAGVNETPTVGTPPSLTVTEDAGASTLDLLQGAADIDTGDVLSINSLVPTGNNGGITLSGTTLNINPAFYNTLAAGASEVITYTYNVVDNNGASVAQTASVTITGVNDAPVAVADTNSVDADLSVSLMAPGVLGNDTDVDIGDTLSVTEINGNPGDTGRGFGLPSGAFFSMNADGSYSYAPSGVFDTLALGITATDTINYTISDGNGGTANANLTITVTGVNDAPTVSGALTLNATEDDGGTPTLDLLSGASDVDTGDTLSVTNIVPTGNAGGISITGSTLSLTPNFYNSLAVGSSEVVSYAYDVIDANGATVAQTATVTINGVNDAPVAGADTGSVNANLNLSSAGVLVNDTDVDIGDVLVVSAINGNAGDVGMSLVLGSGALITMNSDGTYDYLTSGVFDNLALGVTATETISYTVSDGNGGTSISNLTITITGVNEAPTVSGALTLNATEDDGGTPTLDLLSGASDVDIGDTLSVTNIVPSGNDVGISITGSTLSLTPNSYTSLNAISSEVISYTYDVIDSNGATVAQTATVTITGVNDAPVAIADVDSTDEDSSLSTAGPGVLGNDTDVDDGAVLTVTKVNGAGGNVGVTLNLTNADIQIDSDGGYSVLPLVELSLGQTVTESVTYTVSDAEGGTSSSTLTISITGLNDTPSIPPGQYFTNESSPFVSGSSLIVNGVDPDPLDTLSFVSVFDGGVTVLGDSSPQVLGSGATLEIDAAGNITNYDATDSRLIRGFDRGEFFTENLLLTISDDNAATATTTVTIAVAGESSPELFLLSHDNAILEPALDIVGDTGLTLQAAAVQADNFVSPNLRVLSFADSGGSDALATTATNVATTNILTIDRSNFSVNENRFLIDDKLPSTTIEGLLNGVNDSRDGFAVTLKAGELLILDIDGGKLQGYSGDLEITVFNSANAVVTQNDNGGLTDEGSEDALDPLLLFRSSTTDTYTIVVAETGTINPDGSANATTTNDTIDYTLNLSIEGSSTGEFKNNDAVVINETEINPTHTIGDLSGSGLLIYQDDLLIRDFQLVADNTSAGLPRMTIRGSLGSAGGNNATEDLSDSFQIKLNNGDQLILDVDGADEGIRFDSKIEVKSAAGIPPNDDAMVIDAGSNGTLDSFLTYNSTATETVTVTITMLSGGLYGDYILNVSLVPVGGTGPFGNGEFILDERTHHPEVFRPIDTTTFLDAAPNNFGIATFNNKAGSLLLFGDALPANYEQVLQTVSIGNLASDPKSAFLNVQFSAIDNAGDPFRITSRDVKQNSSELQLKEVINSGGMDGRFSATKLAQTNPADGIFGSGDINGDGFDDLIVSDLNNTSVVFGDNAMDGNLDNAASVQLSLGTTTTATNIYITEVTHAGDVNGDGYDDLIGKLNYFQNTTTYTNTFVLFGSASPNTNDLGDVLGGDTSLGLIIDAPNLIAVGDLDGDGFDDLVATNAGQSLLVFGADSFNAGELDGNLRLPLTGTFAEHLELPTSTNFADNSVLKAEVGANISPDFIRAAGDVNGDGLGDLLMGFEYYSTLYIVYGQDRDSLEARTLSPGVLDIEQFWAEGNSQPLFTGDRETNLLNARGIGDINGDGFGDLAVSIANQSPSAKYQGDRAGTFVIFGGPSLDSFADQIFDKSALTIQDLVAGDGTAGFRIASSELDLSANPLAIQFANITRAGDINGDGFDDIIVRPYISKNIGPTEAIPSTTILGDPVIVYGGTHLSATGTGQLDVANLKPGDGRELQSGNQAYNSYATVVAGTGDFNGDGFDDFFAFDNTIDLAGVLAGGGNAIDGNTQSQEGTVLVFGGTQPNDALVIGGDLSDNIVVRAGNQIIRAGAGNDFIEFDPADTIEVNGGGGVDTLNVTTPGETLNLTTTNPFKNIEVIGLNNNTTTLVLDREAVLKLTDTDVLLLSGDPSLPAHTLLVTGGASDTVQTLDPNWVANGTVSGYNRYDNGNVTILVDPAITQTGIQAGIAGVDDITFDISTDTGTFNLPVGAGILTEINGSPVSNSTPVSVKGIDIIITDVSTGAFTYDVDPGDFDALVGLTENGYSDFTFTVDDGGNLDVARALVEVDGTLLVDAPLNVNFNGYTPTYAGGNVFVPIVDAGFTLTDPNTKFFTFAMVTIDTGGLGSFFVDPAMLPDNISFSFGASNITINPGSGTNAALLSDLEAFLKTVSYVPAAGDSASFDLIFDITTDVAITPLNLTVSISQQPADVTAAGDWDTGATWVGSVEPISTDDVILHNLTGALTSNTNNTVQNLVVANSAASVQVNDSILTVNGLVSINDADASGGIIVSAASAPAMLHGQDILINELQSLNLISSPGFTATLKADNGVVVHGSLIADFLPTTTTTVTVETPLLDVVAGTIELKNAATPTAITHMEISNPAGVAVLRVGDQTVFIGDKDATLTLTDGRIELTSDFELYEFTTRSSTGTGTVTYTGPSLILAGDGEIAGPHTFTNSRPDFVFDSDDLLADATLVNKGLINFTTDLGLADAEARVDLEGKFINDGIANFFTSIVHISSDLTNRKYGELILGDENPTQTSTATLVLTDDNLTLHNQGAIIAADPGQSIEGNINSEGGSIEVDAGADLTIINTSSLLTLAGAFIGVQTGATLTVDGGDVVIDNQTLFSSNDTVVNVVFASGAKVHNGAEALIVDKNMVGESLLLAGQFQLGPNSINILKAPELGSLNNELANFALDFSGVVDVLDQSIYNLDLDSGATSDSLAFEEVDLGGTIRPAFGSAPVAGETYVFVTALTLFGSFGYLEDAAADLGDDVMTLTYDDTAGASSVGLNIVATTQNSTTNAGAAIFTGTGGVDIIKDTQSGNTYSNIGPGDVVVDFNAGPSTEIFEISALDFNRLSGDPGSLNQLVLTAAGEYDFTQLRGTDLENFSEFILADASQQDIILDSHTINHIFDDSDPNFAFPYLHIHSETPGLAVGDTVTLRGEFLRDASHPDVIYTSPEAEIHIEPTVFVTVERFNGSDIFGTTLDETIQATGGDDLIDGGGGDDSVDAQGGNDTIIFDAADLGLIDGGSGLDTLLLDSDTLNLSGVSNLVNFEKIELAGDGSTLNLTFDDLFGTGNFLETGLIDTYSTDGAFGDHQLLITGDSVNNTITLEGVVIGEGNAALMTELGSAGVTQGDLTIIDGVEYLPFTKGDVTLFLTLDLFETNNVPMV